MSPLLDRLQGNGAAHGADQFAHDGQPDTASLARRRRFALALDEGIEDALTVLGSDSGPLVDTLEA